MKGKGAIGPIREWDKPGPRRLVPKRGVAGLSMAVLGGLNWYAVMVKAGSEFPVARQLEARAGLVAVVPVRREWRRVNRYVKRKHEVRYPLLARYVFVGFGHGVASSYADEVRGLAQLMRELTLLQSVVGMDGLPRRMEALKVARFLNDLGEVVAPVAHRHMPTHGEFAAGDDVQIMSGPFEGQIVRVHAISGPDAHVLLPLFGDAEQNVRVPLANLERAD
ncbi:MAG: hypothetical protein HY834_08975 [Devosia nanyangense]|uniref:NusG-like N-terminal domain-containing protein n=1 Tax=Devosia nanyangense TaxID=1228055 RepID=A0A933L087_9HYPH|nr:hypothetical protein [Devosia nanyangense]